MKYSITTALLLFFAMTVYGQSQQTLFSQASKFGGFGGPIIEISSIDGQTVGGVGGGGAFVLDDFFIGGYGISSDGANIKILDDDLDIDFGHGGLWFGYAYPSQKLIHGYASLRIGWGDVELNEKDGDTKYDDNHMTISPELGVEINLTSWARIGLSGGYRLVNGLDNLAGGLTDDSFSGAYGGITFRFGGFGYYDDYEDDVKVDFEF